MFKGRWNPRWSLSYNLTDVGKFLAHQVHHALASNDNISGLFIYCVTVVVVVGITPGGSIVRSDRDNLVSGESSSTLANNVDSVELVVKMSPPGVSMFSISSIGVVCARVRH